MLMDKYSYIHIYLKQILFFVEKICSVVPDELFIKMQYFFMTGKALKSKKPRTFNEKIQWIKLNDRNEQYTELVDKFEVKKYVSKLIGEDYVIPTIGIWEHPDEINWKLLPDSFVLKCTHDSGGVVICSDKNKLDKRKVMTFLETRLKRNFYWHGREWAYKNVKPRIIAEPYLTDESGSELKDYKVFCFNGEPKLIQVDFGRYIDHHRNIYDTEWKYQNVSIKYPTLPDRKIVKPIILDNMLKKAKILSKGFYHARVDFYVIGEKLLFGEITLYHGNGCEKITPEAFSYAMGDWINIGDIR